jgi:alkylation response protein AidB-like acyl-CoA dehydrogenase
MSLADRYLPVLDKHLPSLSERLGKIGHQELECESSLGIESFRACNGPGLLVPERHGGSGVSARDAVRCVRAIGALAPSLSVATTMHNFSVAALVSVEDNFDGFEWMILDAVANDRLLISSAFAEGVSGHGFLTPTMKAVRRGDTWVVNGAKRPCSLSRSMDLMSASVSLLDGDNEPELGILVIPATLDGITREPFWEAAVLRAAESDAVILKDVEVPDVMVMKPGESTGVTVDDLEARALVWFTLLISAAYLGMAGSLVDRMLAAQKGSVQERMTAACDIEAAMMSIEQVALVIDHDVGALQSDAASTVLPNALVARYASQAAIRRAVGLSVEALGGISFITDPMVGYLASATNALAFHPPSRQAMAHELEQSFMGEQLSLA